ncbi:MAG: excinuclease ABC subunit UvrA [Clostridia bacterium]|nr:excinuclease ABC subunit UvrA [Clostridia bacterium]
MMNEQLIIKGAREHNLKDVDITLPRNKLIVFTGLSGSGKSSLAFDTIYAEGQRRYVESLSSYARLFLGQMDKPDVDYIEGLSPAISIDQKSTSNNPRSTVGTVTEIHDYFRLLYARTGHPHCPKCGLPIERQSIDVVVDRIMALGEGRIQIIAPAVRAKKGEHAKLLEQIRKDGYVRVRVDGEVYDINEVPPLNKQKKHTIDVIVDRLIIKPGIESRLAESMETAFAFGDGLAKVDVIGKEELLFSEKYSCPDCGISIPELTPRMFSFNNPYGACPCCSGLGSLMKVDPDLVVPDKSLSLSEGAISVSGWQSGSSGGSMAEMYFGAIANHYGFSMDVPYEELPEKAKQVLLYGTGDEKMEVSYQREYGSGTFKTSFEGIITNLERRYHETQSDGMKQVIEGYMSNIICPECNGKRLKPESLAVTVGGKSIAEVSDMTVSAAGDFINNLTLTETERMIAERIVKEISARLGFLKNVGLDYLTLSRGACTLSGGEAQRIRLATQIGSGLMGVLYILDEPSIGLHQRDNARLLDTLKGMRDMGNTLIVVEHDEETMLSADYLVDIGPGAGEHGGRIVAEGTPEEIMASENSITGQFLSGRRFIPVPDGRRDNGGRWLRIKNARVNNLKNIDVDIPLGVFTCVTGVSGSGKSSLVNEVVKKTLLHDLNRAKHCPKDVCDSIEGIQQLDKIIDIDQSPIGRTPRSNPATYTGLFDMIRDIFAMTPDAKVRGYNNGRFSFNVKGGRCEACRGDGMLKIEMHFLPDVYVPCEVCKGKRYNRETLEVKYKGKSIADVLDMTVEEALEFFRPIERIKRKLQTLQDVGLGYIKLGQPSTTLSGGEAQRVKLATELSRRDTGNTMYVLDEPTTGLHMADVERLLEILRRLAEGGSTVVVIEHNLDVIKCADYIIDMGPEGGAGGGTVVARGTPEEVAKVHGSYTGKYLAPILKRDRERTDKNNAGLS